MWSIWFWLIIFIYFTMFIVWPIQNTQADYNQLKLLQIKMILKTTVE